MAVTTPLTTALRNLGLSAIGLVQTRLALFSTEWEEERARITRIWIAMAATLFFALLAMIAAGAFVVVAFWDTHRLLALGGVGALFALAALASALVAANALASKPRLFAATLAALRDDTAALAGRGELERTS